MNKKILSLRILQYILVPTSWLFFIWYRLDLRVHFGEIPVELFYLLPFLIINLLVGTLIEYHHKLTLYFLGGTYAFVAVTSLVLFLLKFEFWGAISLLMISCAEALTLFAYKSYLDLSYAGSGREWYQRRPRVIPSLFFSTSSFESKVSKIDKNGFYVWSHQGSSIKKGDIVEGKLKWKNLELPVKLSVFNTDPTGGGMGIKIFFEKMDQRKEYRELIEQIKGEGHV